MLLCFCPVGCLSLAKLNWDNQLGRDRTTSGCNNNKNLIGPILFFQFEFKTKYLGFIVLILVHTYWSFQTTCTLFVYHQNEFLSHNHHRSFSLIFRLLITYPALEVRNEDFDKSEPANTKLLRHHQISKKQWLSRFSGFLAQEMGHFPKSWFRHTTHRRWHRRALIASMVCSNPLNILMLTSS